MLDFDQLSILLRAMVYAATVMSAGGVLVFLSLHEWRDDLKKPIWTQVLLGCLLLLVAEPLRYVLFQLNVSGGNIDLAFDPDLRWMAFETAMGQAAVIRFVAALLLLVFWSRNQLFSGLIALAMIGSFALEGHTASHEPRWLLAGLLAIHLVVVHWWLGALWPLISCSKTTNHESYAAMVERFGRIAMAAVPLLLAAGALLLAILSHWLLDLSLAYQQRFLFKLAGVAGVIFLAARNKLWLTPLLTTDPTVGAARLRASIGVESILAIAVIFATAYMVHTAPGMTHTE